MQKYDKSLIEVWEWKDKVYQDFKDLTVAEYVKKVREELDAIMAKHGIKLKRVKAKKELQKTARSLV
jgi:hypothetical protein